MKTIPDLATLSGLGIETFFLAEFPPLSVKSIARQAQI